VYPALAVLDRLQDWKVGEERLEGGIGDGSRPSDLQPFKLELLWIGGVGGMEAELVQRAGVPYGEVAAAGLHGVGMRALPRNLWQIGRGTYQARSVMRTFNPDVIFFTGGFVAAPIAIAARSMPGRRVPILLYVPDIEPGLALKALARFADCIAVTAEDSRAYFPYKKAEVIRVVGYPTRSGLEEWTDARACSFLELRADLPTLLVFGGSSGARSINRALLGILPDLLAEMQVVHISGRLDWKEVDQFRQGLNGEQASRYRAYPYLHEMGAALRAADLVVSRAGASTLGEFPLFGLPAILVPYPHAWRYQMVNAEYLANRGAAVILEDDELPGKLAGLVREILGDTAKREAMRRAMLEMSQPRAAENIGRLLLDMGTAG
jgi:UDP-N-acetylglucosamine--N-acetylmuramyl-(pentapeptide) pyrophosphoryl-undecaprenol N-acetylglucosamine transferase